MRPVILWLLLQIMPSIALISVALNIPEEPVQASIGLAEWEVTTPGGHRISSIDPIKEEHGISLRAKSDDTKIYIDQIQWWQYYPGLVVGAARQGSFLFDEVTNRVTYFKSEAELKLELTRRQLKTPLSKRYTPQDGWNEAWLPIMKARCQEFITNPRAQSQMSESERDRIRQYCDEVKSWEK